MPRVLFDRDYFSVPNKLIDRWAWTELDPICFPIICTYLRIAFGNFQVSPPSQKRIASQLGISRRTLIRQHQAMEEKGILRTVRTRGGISTIDLNPLKAYLVALSPPNVKLGFSVDNPVDNSKITGGGCVTHDTGGCDTHDTTPHVEKGIQDYDK